jgi:hypothetical protein
VTLPAGFRRADPVRCEPDAEDRMRLILLRYTFVAEGGVHYRNGAIEYLIDLSRLPVGDGPAAELMIRRELERHTRP